MEPAKRDDFEPELSRAIEEAFRDEFPRVQVNFLGDVPQEKWPEGVSELLQSVQADLETSLREGRCVDCGAKIPGEWPPPDRIVADGWSLWTEPDGKPAFLVCPACDSD